MALKAPKVTFLCSAPPASAPTTELCWCLMGFEGWIRAWRAGTRDRGPDQSIHLVIHGNSPGGDRAEENTFRREQMWLELHLQMSWYVSLCLFKDDEVHRWILPKSRKWFPFLFMKCSRFNQHRSLTGHCQTNLSNMSDKFVKLTKRWTMMLSFAVIIIKFSVVVVKDHPQYIIQALTDHKRSSNIASNFQDLTKMVKTTILSQHKVIFVFTLEAKNGKSDIFCHKKAYQMFITVLTTLTFFPTMTQIFLMKKKKKSNPYLIFSKRRPSER